MPDDTQRAAPRVRPDAKLRDARVLEVGDQPVQRRSETECKEGGVVR
jgi:hypothetical protein